MMLGQPTSRGTLDYTDFRLQLLYKSLDLRTEQGHGFFEDAFEDLNQAIPPGLRILSCFNCVFAAYNPGGGGAFGYLGCFREHKDDIRAIKESRRLGEQSPSILKKRLFHLWPRLTEYVQEINCCPEFELMNV